MKIIIESFLIIFMLSKIIIYLIDMNMNLSLLNGLSYSHILLESFLMFLHVIIVLLFVSIRK